MPKTPVTYYTLLPTIKGKIEQLFLHCSNIIELITSLLRLNASFAMVPCVGPIAAIEFEAQNQETILHAFQSVTSSDFAQTS